MSARAISDEEVGALMGAARRAGERAYAPYSSFRVGAAVLSDSGAVVEGCNIENVSYGLTICAERNALFAAVAAGHHDLIALAVSCIDGDRDRPWTLMPCGACRQVMVELLPADAAVLVDGVGRIAIEELLPRAFRLSE